MKIPWSWSWWSETPHDDNPPTISTLSHTHTHIDLCCSPYRLNTLPNLQEYLEFLQSVTKMTKPLCGLWTPCVVLCTPLTKLASPTPGRAAMHTKQFSPRHSPRMAHRWNYPNYTSVKRFSQRCHFSQIIYFSATVMNIGDRLVWAWAWESWEVINYSTTANCRETCPAYLPVNLPYFYLPYLPYLFA